MLSTLAVFGYVAALMAPAMCCLPKEYETRDGECCPMCYEETPGLLSAGKKKKDQTRCWCEFIPVGNTGKAVQRDCTKQSGTVCRDCVNETYMNQPNGRTNCFLCTSCDQGHGLFVQQECTAKTDTICEVLSGYFCKHLMDGSGCRLAKKHSPCAPGHRVKVPGTSRNDTVCELCQPGHFSQDGLNCTAWTSCSANQVQIKVGSSSSDVVCVIASRMRFFYIPVIIAMLLSLALVMTGTLSSKKKVCCSVRSAPRKDSPC